MKKVLLTGTGQRGFVGRNLREALQDKYDLVVTTSRDLDLRDFDAVKTFIRNNRIESVILSAATIEDTLDANLRMFFNLEQLSGELDKIIYFGSGAEFDKQCDIVMATEDDLGLRIPIDAYGFAKYIMAKHAKLSKNIYCLRFFGIFGKYEDWSYKFISNLCCKALFDLPLTIRRDCKFDYISIEDLSPVVEWMLENQPAFHDYNFVSGRPILLTEIAQFVKDISGKDIDILLFNQDEMNNEYTAANSRLFTQIPEWKITSIRDAIENLYCYYQKQQDNIDYNILLNSR
ncbi:hypothetical protein AGMMS49983_09380 [Clostridia bacterium]|nr:hypothetical protein AGMMS49983_09380 [Clostridia bacterium]